MRLKSFITNSWLKDKDLVKSTIVRSLNDSEKGFIVSDQKLRTLGCCVTKTLPLTLPSLRERIFDQKVYFSVSAAPILARSEFLFPELKFYLKRRHFGAVDNIQKVVTDQLRALPHEDFQHRYWEWEQRLWRCVDSQGNHSEGDNVDLYFIRY